MSSPPVEPDTPYRAQFGLKQLFAVVTVAGSGFGVIHWLGVPGAVVFGLLVGGTVLGYVLPSSPSDRIAGAMAGLLAGSLLSTCIAPMFQQPTCPAPRRSQWNNNLKQLGLGLQTHADIFKSFPADFSSYGGEPAGDETPPRA